MIGLRTWARIYNFEVVHITWEYAGVWKMLDIPLEALDSLFQRQEMNEMGVSWIEDSRQWRLRWNGKWCISDVAA